MAYKYERSTVVTSSSTDANPTVSIGFTQTHMRVGTRTSATFNQTKPHALRVVNQAGLQDGDPVVRRWRTVEVGREHLPRLQLHVLEKVRGSRFDVAAARGPGRHGRRYAEDKACALVERAVLERQVRAKVD